MAKGRPAKRSPVGYVEAGSHGDEGLRTIGRAGRGSRPRLRGRARVAAINAAWTLVGLVVVALAAEGWARSRVGLRSVGSVDAQVYKRLIEDFETPVGQIQVGKSYIHPRAGRLLVPGSEIHHTNILDYWNVTRVNRWGFLDRPPLPLDGITTSNDNASCRVAVVGDSFVAAEQVPIADKLHVRLEDMARERLPALRVATSAFGHTGTGTVHQLGYYDEFVSRISPRVVVLVFYGNDFFDNHPVLKGVRMGYGPDGLPWTSARRNADGAFLMRPPDPGAYRNMPMPHPKRPLLAAVRRIARSTSHFALFLDAKVQVIANQRTVEAKRSARDPRLSISFVKPFNDARLSEATQEALDYTGFALDEWKTRAERDNFVLLMLSTHRKVTRENLKFDHMHALASARDIPVVDQYAYIVRQNGRIRDAHWAHDYHWNTQGHQWAAEALLEWLEHNRDACA